MNVILASASPRRKELLKILFQEFQIIPADVDENVDESVFPQMIPEVLSVKKADAIAEKYRNSLVIAADTLVFAQDEILGKPADANHAKDILNLLSDSTHRVITGCCICLNGKKRHFSQSTLVTFYPLSEEEISDYIQSGEPFGKAGAYAIQERGSLFVKCIEGDYFNVIGLPIAKLKREINLLLQEIKEESTSI